MCHRSSSSVILINYSCVHSQIATFGSFSRQSVTLDIGLNTGCSHHRDNRPSEQSAKCTIGQALLNCKYDHLYTKQNALVIHQKSKVSQKLYTSDSQCQSLTAFAN